MMPVARKLHTSCTQLATKGLGDAPAEGPSTNAPQIGLLFPAQSANRCCMMIRKFVIALCLLIAASPTWASTSRRSSRSAHRSAPRSAARSERRSAVARAGSSTKKCTTCVRTANGRIARNPAARRSFQAVHPCPATGKTSGACPGFVVDHIKPLKRGRADAPGNRQWQTTAAAKAKDKIE